MWYSPFSLPTQPVLIRALARRGSYTVTAQWSGVAVSPTEMAPLLEKLLDQAEPAWHGHPIDLPESCPPVEDPLLTAVIERVDYARGSDAAGDHWFCTYGGDVPGIGQSQLRVRALPADPDLVQARLDDFERIENDGVEATTVTVGNPNPRTTIGRITDYDGEHVTVVNRDGAVMLARLTPDLPHISGVSLYRDGFPRKALDRFVNNVAEPVIARAELP
ncbi:hypothetical protein [Nocardioides sp.]|uniref:hypothetical protein n=1 Tax=Nocardioides sp. TaxID=35761 RepID=UPI002732E98A|nr:hypothetical protein [Nocardioides sp.]MDP3893424.1 hypothetical protein [Nocardioides sp.]